MNDVVENEEFELDVRIWRGDENGCLVNYQIPARANQTVLDVVTEIQRCFEPGLAYRFACRVGVCGSCAMTVNGTPRWTCRTHVNKVANGRKLTIEPLRNLPVLKDLVCDMAPFIDSWEKAGAPFRGVKIRREPPERVDPQSDTRKAADAGLQCINCAVCYSACEVVKWNSDYLGPAGLNRAWTLVNDVRHSQRQQTLHKASASGGCGSCHSHGNCTRLCPVKLTPSESIIGLKRSLFVGLPG